MEYIYVKEKLYDVIKHLATAKGDMRQRLKDVIVDLDIIDNQPLPQNLEKKWNTVIKLLTKNKEKYNYKKELELGIFEVSLNKMQNKTACKIATVIFELYEALDK